MAHEQSRTPTARQVARALHGVSDRLGAVVDQLNRAGDQPISAELNKELTGLLNVMRSALESATPTTKSELEEVSDEQWPRDMADTSAAALTWGRDPKALRHV